MVTRLLRAVDDSRTTTMSLDRVRDLASLGFALCLWLFVPYVYYLARSNRVHAGHVALTEVAAAAIATLAWRFGGRTLLGRLTIAAALTFLPIDLVWASTGAWQVDYHMTFFVVYAALVAYVDWRPIVVSGVLTAAHHLILDQLDPSAVFPEENLGRVVLHGVIVLFECAVLFWIVGKMRALFDTAATSLASAEAAVNRLRLFESSIEYAGEKVLISKPDVDDRSRFRVVYVNPSLEAATGYERGELVGQYSELFRGPTTDPTAIERLFAVVRDGIRRTVEINYYHRDGSWRAYEASAHVLRSEAGDVEYLVVVARDIGERKAAEAAVIEAQIAQQTNEGLRREIERRERVEQELAHAAFHDQLTDLPNRTLLKDRLEHALKRSGRRGARHVAVAFLDCDRFKSINDTFGHSVGDLMLISLARRLERILRPGDTLARIGGDEFIILLDEIANENEARSFAERILESFSEPFMLEDHEIFATASIGIALNARGDETGDDMMRDADIAMYRAKSDGKRRYRMFHPDLADGSRRRFQLENDLRVAVERNEIEVYYQSILTLDDGRIAGFEALARWHHPSFGLVSPVEFIPLAEETGRIGTIGSFVMYQACLQARSWQTEVPGASELTMNVNVSAAQLLEERFVEGIAHALRETGLPPHTLHVEITESVLMKDPDKISVVLDALRALGVELHLDDFGTGYSSLAYLHRFPVNALKIDKSFVSGGGAGLANPEIVETIIALARQLNLKVTAEGIETGEQRQALADLSCYKAQGYLFSKPLDVDASTAFLRHQLKPSFVGAS